MPRILMVTSSMPWPPHGGGNQRTNLLYRALQARGEVDVVVISRYATFSDADKAAVQRDFNVKGIFELRLPEYRLPWKLARALSPSLPHRLTHTLGGWGRDFAPDREVMRWIENQLMARPYDLVVGRYLWALSRSGMTGRLPTLLDVDDFETDVAETNLGARKLSSLKARWGARRVEQVRRAERRVLDGCDHLWVAKEEDLARVPHDRKSILPNIPFVREGRSLPEACPPNAASKVVLMVGTLEHSVNVRAIEAFLADQWPAIRAAEPEAVFRLVGNGMTDAMKDAWGKVPGVEPVGFVDDLRTAYEACAFTVVPIWEGGGTKIKVLESLLYGRTCVVARHSLRGYESVLAHGESLYVADDRNALVAGCLELLRQPDARARLADRGRPLVTRHFSVERFQRTVHEAIDRVLDETRLASIPITSALGKERIA